MQSSSVEFHKRTPEGYLRLGSISGVFGFRGEAKFFLYNPKTDLFGQWLTVFFLAGKSAGPAVEVYLRKGSGKRVVGQIKENGEVIQDEKRIRQLMGTELLLREQDLPSLGDEEFYHHQLLGLPVEDESGICIGTVIEITQGVVDVFTIRRKGAKELLYIPFTKQHVLTTTLEKMVIKSYDTSTESD